MNATRLVFLSRGTGAGPTWVEVDASGAVIARGAFDLHGGYGPVTLAPLRTILVVPGADVLTRWHEVSAHSEAQARAAAALKLAGQLATPAETLHFAVGKPEADGVRLVAAVDRELLQGWLERAATLGVRPDVVVPDHLLLVDLRTDDEPGPPRAVGVAIGDTVAVRGHRLAFTVEADLLGALAPGGTIDVIEDPAAVERLLASGAAQTPINLLQGEFARGSEQPLRWRDLRLAAALGAILLLSPAILSLASIGKHQTAAQRMERAAAARASAVLPNVAITDPQRQMKRKLAELQAGGGFSKPAAALFAALEGVEFATVDQLGYDENGGLRAAISYTNYSDLDLIRASLSKAGVQAQEAGTRNEGGRIVSDLSLRAAS